jgi:HSP20 family protein
MFSQELETWDPWRHLDPVQDAMTQVLWGPRAEAAYPALNAWTNENEAVVTAEIPGINPETLDIQVIGDTLTIRGSREEEKLDESATVLRRERSAGNFSRSLQFPFHLEAEKVNAQAKNGVLTITLPRAEAEKPKKITLKAG